MKKTLLLAIAFSLSLNLFSQVKHLEIGISQTGIENCMTNIENTFGEDVIKIFPNPCDGHITFNILDNALSDELSVSIINVQGKTIFEKKYMKDEIGLENSIDISNQPNGLYIIRISSSNKSFVSEIIKN